MKAIVEYRQAVSDTVVDESCIRQLYVEWRVTARGVMGDVT